MPSRASDPERASADRAVEVLVTRFGLRAGAKDALLALLDALVNDATAPTAVRSYSGAVGRHLADALVAVELECVRQARRLVDLGSGAGLPGLPLAIACPHTQVVLLDSNQQKCEFMERAASRCALRNVSVVCGRAEGFQAGFGSFDLATARALAPLAVVVEYAAPLLRVGGTLVAWRGRRDMASEESAAQAAAALGMRLDEVIWTEPYAGATNHHLHLASKVVETPAGFPRAPGRALKRPLGRG